VEGPVETYESTPLGVAELGATDSRPTSMASSAEGNAPSVAPRASAARESVACVSPLSSGSTVGARTESTEARLEAAVGAAWEVTLAANEDLASTGGSIVASIPMSILDVKLALASGVGLALGSTEAGLTGTGFTIAQVSLTLATVGGAASVAISAGGAFATAVEETLALILGVSFSALVPAVGRVVLSFRRWLDRVRAEDALVADKRELGDLLEGQVVMLEEGYWR